LKDQDRREQLSDSVLTLAKKMNGLCKKLKAEEEETKMSLLDRIDENSIILVTSMSNSTSASVSSGLSAHCNTLACFSCLSCLKILLLSVNSSTKGMINATKGKSLILDCCVMVIF